MKGAGEDSGVLLVLVSKLLMKMTSIGIREWGIVNLCMSAVISGKNFQ